MVERLSERISQLQQQMNQQDEAITARVERLKIYIDDNKKDIDDLYDRVRTRNIYYLRPSESKPK